jgi:Ca2+-binding EF-hand superfamily protein
MEKFIDSETLSEMKEAFGVFDQNGDGRISDSGMTQLLFVCRRFNSKHCSQN